MALGLGRRTRNIAVLAGALSSLIGSLPGQPLRDQIRDIATMIETEAGDIADEFEEDDGSLRTAEICVA